MIDPAVRSSRFVRSGRQALSIRYLPGYPVGNIGFLAQRGGGIDLAAHDGDFSERAIRHLVGRDLTVRDVLDDIGRIGTGHGTGTVSKNGQRAPFSVIGTPEEAADEIERWVDETGAAGFNLMQYLSPGTAEDFVELAREGEPGRSGAPKPCQIPPWLGGNRPLRAWTPR
ncbi:hypothetical protein ACQP1W_28780 [Spirillospora sp. CA-255316]